MFIGKPEIYMRKMKDEILLQNKVSGVGVLTWLRTRRSGVRIPAGEWDSSLFQIL
jgi:hypothetical protein